MINSKTIIGLTNPKSPTNVGAVMRAAGCYGVDKVFYTGTRYERASAHQTDTKNMLSRIPLAGVNSWLDTIPTTLPIVCVELAVGAIPLPEFKHPEQAIYLFGPEDGTIEQAVLDRAEAVVYVPTQGCMNLAATVNVVLYDRLAKSANIEASDALIMQSRDRNNKVTVK